MTASHLPLPMPPWFSASSQILSSESALCLPPPSRSPSCPAFFSSPPSLFGLFVHLRHFTASKRSTSLRFECLKSGWILRPWCVIGRDTANGLCVYKHQCPASKPHFPLPVTHVTYMPLTSLSTWEGSWDGHGALC